MNPFDPPRSKTVTRQNLPTRGSHFPTLLIAFALSIIAGGLVWALSPTITGQIEPWDESNSYYSLAILLAAAIPALFSRWHLWIPMLGVYVGQNIYCFFFWHPETAIIFPAFIGTAIMGFVPSLVGAILGSCPFALKHVLRD